MPIVSTSEHSSWQWGTHLLKLAQMRSPGGRRGQMPRRSTAEVSRQYLPWSLHQQIDGKSETARRRQPAGFGADGGGELHWNWSCLDWAPLGSRSHFFKKKNRDWRIESAFYIKKMHIEKPKMTQNWVSSIWIKSFDLSAVATFVGFFDLFLQSIWIKSFDLSII